MKIKILKVKEILGAVLKLPAKYHSQSSPIWVKMGQIGCAIQQVTSIRLLRFFSYFQDIFFLNDFIKKPQTRNARVFLPLNISAVGSVVVSNQVILEFSSNNIVLIRNEMIFFPRRSIARLLMSLQLIMQGKNCYLKEKTCVIQQDFFPLHSFIILNLTNSLYNQIWIGIVYKKRAKSNS